MIDIFNPQKVNSKESNIFNLFRKKIKSEFIPILEKNYLKKFTLEATNIYQHYKTTNPRKAHYDNEDNYYCVDGRLKYWAWVYLHGDESKIPSVIY